MSEGNRIEFRLFHVFAHSFFLCGRCGRIAERKVDFFAFGEDALYMREREEAPRAVIGARAALPQSTDQRALIGIGALVGVVAVAFLVYVSLGWFGPFADRSYVAPEVQPPSDGSIEPIQPHEAEEEEAPLVIEGGPEVRGTLGEYSWPELAQISSLISAAETDEKGVEIAHYYGLCDVDGTIYTDNTKSLDLANGVSVPMEKVLVINDKGEKKEEMKKVLLESHVFVCPSAVENSPNSVAEAQLLGLPVAASRAGGIPSVVEDKRGGLLFEKGNPRDLARAVKEIFSSDGLARSLSKSERQFAAPPDSFLRRPV